MTHRSRMILKMLLLSCLIVGGIGAMAGAEEKMKIIFDTDIAGDIDDAFAQALVMISSEFDVLGITVADGPTDRRARVSCRMLYECGLEGIPVAVGRPTRPGESINPQLTWGEGFDRVRPVGKSAVDFIIEQLKNYPHQVTIISVGPVTNLGDVIDKDPGAWNLVKGVYSMFGSFYMGYDTGPVPDPEWNVRCDVASAKKFMSSGVPITLAGLDVTTMVKFGPQRRLSLLMRSSPLTDALSALTSLWSLNQPGRDPTLFDPVAVSMALNAGFVQTRRAHVTVTEKGYTVIDESLPPNCTIGMSIRKDDFLDWLTRRLLEQNLMR